MTTLREAAQQALEAWDGGDTEWFKRAYTVMEALRAALAEPVEPVAWTLTKTLTERKTTTNGHLWFSDPQNSSWTPLYTAPPQRPAEPVQEPVANDDEVICPACCHQFRAIPPNVQQLMLNAGFKPPFTTPPQRKPLTEEEIDSIWDSEKVFPDIYAIARAIERAQS